MPGRIAGETDRRRRAPRLRARAADPRAAHPPREGDPQHLHLAGAERARRRDLPRLARQARASSSSASCWPGAPPTRASAWRASTGSSCSTRRRSCASSRSGSTRRLPTVLDRVAEEGIAAGYPLGREYPEYEDGLLVAITERRSKEDIDRLADALGRAIAANGAFRTHSGQKRANRGGGRARERRPAPPRRPPTPTPRPRSSGSARPRSSSARSPAAAPARCPPTRRPRAPPRRADPAATSCASARPSCPRSPSPRSSATTTASRAATSTSTPGPTRSARAR